MILTCQCFASTTGDSAGGSVLAAVSINGPRDAIGDDAAVQVRVLAGGLLAPFCVYDVAVGHFVPCAIFHCIPDIRVPQCTMQLALKEAVTPEEEGKLTSRRCPGCPCTIQVRSMMGIFVAIDSDTTYPATCVLHCRLQWLMPLSRVLWRSSCSTYSSSVCISLRRLPQTSFKHGHLLRLVNASEAYC